MRLFRLPLVRLLAINLAAGAAIAALMLGGLMALNPGNLRSLIFSDRDSTAALVLLGLGLVVTFGSVAMGTAVMTLGRKPKRTDGGGASAPVQIAARAR